MLFHNRREVEGRVGRIVRRNMMTLSMAELCVACFRCQRPGHLASDCPFGRLVVMSGGDALLWPSPFRMGWGER
jgi:hypothetical protein